jgi:PAS domain S-box-containing protein
MTRQPGGRDALDPRRALDAVGQAVIITDAEGRITFWNAAAERLFGWSAGEVLGRPVLEVTPAEHEVGDAAALLAALQAGETWSGEMVLRRRDGTTFLGRVTDTPIMDDAGAVVGIIGVSEDVTERRAAEMVLRRSEQRLRLALDAGRMGVWQWDRGSDRLECDRTVAALFGFPGEPPATIDAYAERLHPDDREPTLAAFEAAAEGSAGYRVEYRVVRPDGTVRWVETHGQRIVGNGQVHGLVGVSQDVTDRHRHAAERTRLLAEESRARAEADAARARLEFLAQATAALTETLDLDERLDRLGRVGVPRLADCCAVYLLDDGGEPRLIALHHADPVQQPLFRELVASRPVHLDVAVGPGAAIRQARTSWVSKISDDLLATLAADDLDVTRLRTLDLRSGLSVPLVGRAGPIGAVTFYTVGSREFDGDDVELAEQLCLRAGVLVESGQLLQARERDQAAQRYQAALLAALFEASVDGVVVVDPEGRVLSHNRRFVEMWGFDPAIAEAGDDNVLLDAARGKVAHPDAFMARVRELYADPSDSAHDEVLLADGRVFDRHGAPLYGDDGEYFGWAWNFRDITLERAQQAEIAAAGERFATLARTLQRSLLPPRLPSPAHLDLAACYHAALEGIDVGGDFYDVFPAGDDWILVIGDVCGKGPRAATITALVRYAVRAAAVRTTDPARILSELNAVMLSDDSGSEDPRFATVCCVHLRAQPDAGVLARIACGGHPPPLVLRRDGTVEPAGAPGTLVGLFDDVDIPTTTVLLAVGDAIVAVTDGVLEARDGTGAELDETGLVRILAGLGDQPADRVSEEVERQALSFQGGVARDDIAVLVARVRPST